MAKIKGQNLRLFVNGKVVAAATSCQLHVGTEFQEVNTKDDTNPEWVTQELSKLNWDVSADALVDINASFSVKCSTQGEDAYYYNSPITLSKGQSITVNADDGQDNVFVLDDDTYSLVEGNGSVTYTNNEDSDLTVYVGCQHNSGVTYHVIDANTAESFCEMLINESDITVALSLFRSAAQPWATQFQGKVKVTDVSINAAVGQFANYTVQMTGIGELETNEL